MIHSVVLGQQGRALLENLCASEGLSISEGLRKAAILGLGGTLRDVDFVNDAMSSAREEKGRKETAKPITSGAWVGSANERASCRLPSPWNKRCSARGAFAVAVRNGMALWANGGAR